MPFGVNQPDWSPRCSVARAKSFVVDAFANGKIVHVPDVERLIRAAEDVNEWHLTTMPQRLVRGTEALRLASLAQAPLDSPACRACHEGAREAGESSGAEERI
jgi:hypothetical protein